MGICCSKEEKRSVYSSEKPLEDLHEVVTSAQGGTFDIYVPQTPKLSQVFPFPYKWDGVAWVPASTAEYQPHAIYSSENPQLHQVVTSVQGGMFEFHLPITPQLNQVYPFPYKWDGRAWVPASKADVQSFQNQRSIHQGRTSRGHSRGYNCSISINLDNLSDFRFIILKPFLLIMPK